jgi:hypothetical protein
MSNRKRTKPVHAGRYVAEVDVELIEDETGWSPYLTPADAFRLDDVREAAALKLMNVQLPIARVLADQLIISGSQAVEFLR